MLKRAGGLNNSIGPNTLDDKTAMNYKALAICISGIEYQGKIKYPSISQVCSAYKIVCDYDEEIDGETTKYTLAKENKERRYNSRLKFIVENIITGEKIICNGVGEAAKITGMKDLYVSTYASNGNKYKGVWIIRRADERSRGTTSSRSVEITNIETKEVIEFKTVKDTASFLKISTATLTRRLNYGQEIDGWKAEYLD